MRDAAGDRRAAPAAVAARAGRVLALCVVTAAASPVCAQVQLQEIWPEQLAPQAVEPQPATTPASRPVPRCTTPPRDNPAWLSLRHDNDVFGGQDQGYTAGTTIEFTSAELGFAAQGGCLPAQGLTARIDRALGFLRPGRDGPSPAADEAVQAASRRRFRVSLNQAVYTPTEYAAATQPILSDRPFAGTLALGLTYQASRLDTLWTTGLQLGVIGPGAQAGWTQRTIHRWGHRAFGFDQPTGWNTQVGAGSGNTVLAQLSHEQVRRFAWTRPPGTGGGSTDLLLHYGAQLGTALRQAGAGVEWRWAPSLPDDFGSSPVRAGGVHTGAAPGAGAARSGWNLFVTAGARYVQYDVTLDGNRSHDTHPVQRRPVVFEGGWGLAGWYDGWRVHFGQYVRTFEFHGQRQAPVYGALSISRALGG